MSYNSNLPVDLLADYSANIRENLRAIKEDKIVDAATAVIADSAKKLSTARVISLTGDATGSTTFDGSADVSITVDVLNANMLDGKTADDIIEACSIYGVPAGAIEYFARMSEPEGWLKADGSAVSRTQYAKLFAAVGTMFGAGDGSTTFNLPDLRGEFIRGFDDGRGVDSNRTVGSQQQDQNKLHSHYATIGANGEGYANGEQVNNTIWKMNYIRDYQHLGNAAHATGLSDEGGTEARPRNVALLACIEY